MSEYIKFSTTECPNTFNLAQQHIEHIHTSEIFKFKHKLSGYTTINVKR